MGLAELFEIGFFTAFWNWSNPILTAIVYAFVFVGALIQIIFQKKSRKPKITWLPIGICGVGIVICECLWQGMTGWERLGLDVIYGVVICLLMGAGMTKYFFYLNRN